MTTALVLGPLVMPYSLLLVLAVVMASLGVAKRLGRKERVDAEPIFWRAFAFGVVLARLGFVYEFRDAYLASPLSIIDIRDGGWSALSGFVGASFYVLTQSVRHPALRKVLHHSLWTASAGWLVGSTALAATSGTGEPMPSIALPSLAGPTLDLASFQGKPTVVNLWATWCPPCGREMPVLAVAQAMNPAVNFVFVDQGEAAEQVAAWLSHRQLTLRNVVLDRSRRVGAAFDHAAYPTTLFFDAKGALVATRIGELSAATLTQKLGELQR